MIRRCRFERVVQGFVQAFLQFFHFRLQIFHLRRHRTDLLFQKVLLFRLRKHARFERHGCFFPSLQRDGQSMRDFHKHSLLTHQQFFNCQGLRFLRFFDTFDHVFLPT